MNLSFLKRRPGREDHQDDELDAGQERLRFVPPALDHEWKRPQVGEVTYRTLEWTAAPPLTPGFRHVRKPGSAKFVVVPVIRNDEGVLLYGDITGIQWRPVPSRGLEWGSSRVQDPAP